MSIDAGDVASVSHMHCSVHSGTHVDAPVHFIPGATTVDALPLDALIGPVKVCHLPAVSEVSAGDLQGLDLTDGVERLLLRTRNSQHWARGVGDFDPYYVALTPDAA